MHQVAVISGGLSHERDVSVRSGRRLTEQLVKAGLEVQHWDVDERFVGLLSARDADVAFVTLHGGSGENGTVQALLELAGLPYVGSTAGACRGAYDKAIAKTRMVEAGVATPRWVTLPSTIFREVGPENLYHLVDSVIGLPLVAKPVQGGSSLGVSLVREEKDLPGALVQAYAYSSEVLLEAWVDGHEVTVPVLDLGEGPQALPPMLIEPPAGTWYDYQARYDASSDVRYTSLTDDDARLDVPAVRAVAEQVHALLGLRDLSRVDVLVGRDGVPQVLEAAVTPGLTETSTFPLAVTSAGLELSEVYATLVANAKKRGG
ncbi:MAG: D-alanine-D-alanine ligase [Frankiales bacterium]|nr:D-alanine--D-alanine ligase [Frankiales bacterium]MDX6265459.1 D-alanine-D-alanine ligase [Frankiales bacterium]